MSSKNLNLIGKSGCFPNEMLSSNDKKLTYVLWALVFWLWEETHVQKVEGSNLYTEWPYFHIYLLEKW